MALNLNPLRWDWPAVKSGNTYPAAQLTDSASDTDLARVVVEIREEGATAVSLTLDSNASGVTINTATAGAWDFTIRAITHLETAALANGFCTYEITTTDSAGTVLTEFEGSWQIIA